jgi:preprotein translocase subunit YajC
MLALIAQTTKTNPLVQLLPFLLIGGVFYLLILRPGQRRAKAQQALINSVEVGDEIVTTGGIYGTITAIDDDEGTVTVQIAPGVEIRMLRPGIGRLVVEDDGSYDEDDNDYDEEEVEDQPSVSDGSQEYPDQPGQIKEL